MMRIPQPASSWIKRGFLSPDPPTRADIEKSVAAGRHARLCGFVFQGEGWYPRHRVLVLQVAPDGWELYFYDHDPRGAFSWLGAAGVRKP